MTSYNIAFVYDNLVVQTTVVSSDEEAATVEARDVLRSYGLRAEDAFEIQIDGAVA